MEKVRQVEFGITGYLNFTKWSKPPPPLQGTLTGKNYVITGANKGIGFAAANFAAARDANVYLICRNKERGTEAMERIKKESGNQKVYLILGQMGYKKSMNQAHQALKEKIDRIDIFVHNAGIMEHQRKFTDDKIELNFAVNTFTIYYMTKLCLDMFHDHTKLISVTSGGMLTQKLITDDLYMESEEFDGMTQYSRNKRQQMALIEHFAKLFPDKGKFVCMHPGFVDTDGVKESMPEFHKKMKDNLKQPAEGADTINYLSVLPFEELKNGEFYFDRQIASKHLPVAMTSYEDKDVDKLVHRLNEL